jgi:DNA-binding NtrC family response regulator
MAALCRESWDRLYPAGPKRIIDVLEEWDKDERIGEALLLVPRVADPDAVRTRLAGLDPRGMKIRWFAPASSQSVANAVEGMHKVELHTESNLRRAFESGFLLDGAPHPLLTQLEEDKDSGLAGYLRYKISLFQMRLLDTGPLLEAVSFLNDQCGEGFSLSRLPEEDERAVALFHEGDFPFLEGKSRPIENLKRRILKVAPTDLDVLVTGETSTGKESVAFYLHEFSPRRSNPFIAFNCAGLDENFLRAELFGYKKGAFRGADSDKSGLLKVADGGTLFLDELEELPLAFQADLLRFLQTGRYRRLGGTLETQTDIRLVAAAQPDLKERIRQGAFREDLFHRIAEVEMKTPALAEIPEDVIRVARNLILRVAGREKFTPEAEAALLYFEKAHKLLEKYTWPGNVRELAALVKRRVLLGDDVLKHLQPAEEGRGVVNTLFNDEFFSPQNILPVDEVVAAYVRKVFDHRKGLTQRQVSEQLGKSLNTVKKLLRLSKGS